MDKPFFIKILRKYLKSKATPEEEALLLSYYNLFENEPDVFSQMSEDKKLRIKSQQDLVLWAHINEQEHRQISLGRRTKLMQWFKIVAVLLLCTTLALLTHKLYTISVNKSRLIAHTSKPNRFMPATTQGVLLKLANGQQIVLDEHDKGKIAFQQQTTIQKVEKGKLVYHSNTKLKETTYQALDTLIVPKKREFQIVLADGTRVYLNAGSSLIFPASFTGTERKVILTGEAYFEVSKNKAMPFKVDVDGHQTVEVLGTHFNINDFGESIHTTLLEGSVKITRLGFQTIIQPGQSANQNLYSNKIIVEEADVNEVIAWRDGYFKFHAKNIRSIMDDMARWYDIDIAYSGAITNHTFSGTYPKREALAEMLQGLEQTGLIHFKIEGRRVTVMP